MRYGLIGATLLAAWPAQAHPGAVVSNARFTSPAAPILAPSADGVVVTPPYDFATADRQLSVAWDDGDDDPTGRFHFYYWDHLPTLNVSVADLLTQAHPMNEVGRADPQHPVTIFASCSCTPDAGLACPDLGDTERDCRNSFDWDTSQLAPGSYWIIAVNDDPPYLVYSVAQAPVRVAHPGQALPPAAIVLRPDGLGTADRSYGVQWLAVGQAPLTIDLAYGDATEPDAPLTAIGHAVGGALAADGTQRYDWDVSALSNLGDYFVRVTVTDGNGASSFSDSLLGVAIYHNGSGGPDQGAGGDPAGSSSGSGCGCSLGAAGATASTPLLLGLFAAAALVRSGRFRRRRTGPRATR